MQYTSAPVGVIVHILKLPNLSPWPMLDRSRGMAGKPSGQAGQAYGCIGIILITWMQTRTPKEMLGRIMSLLMFSSIGLLPVSQAISGAVSKWSLDVLVVTAGTLALLVTFWMTLRPSFKIFSESLCSPQGGDGEPRMDSAPSH
jgi:hypothetical protein